MTNSLDMLKKKLVSYLQETQKRKKTAKKSKVENYFAGQYDAFNQVLLELKIAKYETEMPEQTAEPPVVEEAAVVEEAPVVEEAVVAATEVPDQKETFEEPVKAAASPKKPRKRKKIQPVELSPAQLAAKELLQRAVEAGVIEQKISLYRYVDFPDGRLRGRIPVMELLIENEALAEKITQQIAEKQA